MSSTIPDVEYPNTYLNAPRGHRHGFRDGWIAAFRKMQKPATVPIAAALGAWDVSTRGPQMSSVTGLTIFKYQMPVLEQFEMKLPAGALIIRVEDQGGMFWMWALVDTEAPVETRRFRAFKTGAPVPGGLKLQYVGFCAVFVQMELGLYIFEELS